MLVSVAGAPQLCNLRISLPFCTHRAQGQVKYHFEYPLHHVQSPSTLGHCGNSKAYLEQESIVTNTYIVVEALIYLEINSSFMTKEQPTGSDWLD